MMNLTYRCVLPTMSIFLLISGGMFTTSVFAQADTTPRKSPMAVVNTHYKDTYVKVTYSQPAKRNRDLFGQLIPFGQVWRLGANEATEITLTKDLYINNQLIKAGTYSLFAIPDREKWTLIFNQDLGLWGSYNYQSKADVARIEAPASTDLSPPLERFTISFDKFRDSTYLVFKWDRTQVRLPLRFIDPKP